MKLTEKMKRYLVVSGATVVCVGLLVGIAVQFSRISAVAERWPEQTEASIGAIIQPEGIDEQRNENQKMEMDDKKLQETQEELFLQPGRGTGTEANTGAVADNRPVQTDQPEQSIQPKPVKPEPPAEEVLKNPTRKPDGTTVEGTPEAVEHDKVEKPVENPASSEEPEAGTISGNQIYVPGFGWVENHGGGGTGKSAEDMYENGNKIGSMD